MPLMQRSRKSARADDDRKITNAIFCAGMPWHDLPESYGPYTIAHNRFIRWSRRGIWEWNFDAAGCYRRQTYDCEKVRQQIKDKGALPVIPAAGTSPIKPTVRSASTAAAVENYFCRTRIGGASQLATTSLPELLLLRYLAIRPQHLQCVCKAGQTDNTGYRPVLIFNGDGKFRQPLPRSDSECGRFWREQ